MKWGIIMVNPDFDAFIKAQRGHKTEYTGGPKQRGRQDSSYNNQENTDISPGATGRKS